MVALVCSAIRCRAGILGPRIPSCVLHWRHLSRTPKLWNFHKVIENWLEVCRVEFKTHEVFASGICGITDSCQNEDGTDWNVLPGSPSTPTLRLLDGLREHLRSPEVVEVLSKNCSDIESMHSALHGLWLDFLTAHAIIPSERKRFKKICSFGDLERPNDWYPASRRMKREIFLHVGPTNSGKTHHAMMELVKAKRGAYYGPLRLLAHEVWQKLTALGLSCNLYTGELRHVVDENAQLMSCTVEMANLDRFHNVAVIDEIQLLADQSRGWAWTRALLGLRAERIHLCGAPTAVPLVQRICASVNEKVTVIEHERLSPLQVSTSSLSGNIHNVKKGDCVVAFSRDQVLTLREDIELKTGRKCAVVYGALPPEVRTAQANLFNSPNSGIDVLVATDAVGMGLNL